jgi:hypothetical protein
VTSLAHINGVADFRSGHFGRLKRRVGCS